MEYVPEWVGRKHKQAPHLSYAPDSGVGLTNCPGYHDTYCCYGTLGCSCSNSSAAFTLDPIVSIVRSLPLTAQASITSSTATTTTLTSSSAAATSSVPNPAPNNSVAIGAGVGVGVAAALLLLAAGLLFFFKRRQRSHAYAATSQGDKHNDPLSHSSPVFSPTYAPASAYSSPAKELPAQATRSELPYNAAELSSGNYPK